MAKGRIAILSSNVAATVFADRVTKQAHSPAVAGEQCTMYSCVLCRYVKWTDPTVLKSALPMGDLDTHVVSWAHTSVPLKLHIDQFCAPLTHVPNTQTTINVTSVAIGHIYALRAGPVA